MKSLIHKIRNIIGNLKGYGGCGVCGDTWNWKKEHTIRYGSREVFPFCEECWQTASDEDLIMAAANLANRWVMKGPIFAPDGTLLNEKQNAEIMITAVKLAIKYRKIEVIVKEELHK